MDKLNIIIIDDHPLFRKGMISILEKSEIIGNIYEASTLKQALEILSNNKIDIVTLDLNLPDEDGMNFFNLYDLSEVDFKVLVITTYNSTYLTESLIRHGVKGYLTKESLYENIVHAISYVAAGGIYLEESKNSMATNNNSETKISLYFTLSSAEKEVFKLMALGKSNKEIAAILNKSVKTIETQKYSIMKKLNCTTSLDIFKLALKLNIIKL